MTAETMFEQTAVRLFYERAAKAHSLTRVLSILAIMAIMIRIKVLGWPGALLWVSALAACEVGTHLWYARVFSRASEPDQYRAGLRQLVLIAAALSSCYSMPFIWTCAQGPFSASIGVTVCVSVLLVVAAQHNLTGRMFYTSAAIPGIGLVLNMIGVGGAERAPLLIAMGCVVLLNARNLQHANADVFRDLVEKQLEADRNSMALQVALAAAEAGSRAKSVFLATMSHEIRTPLNGVIGMAESLARADLNPEHTRAIAVIRRSGEALLATLNNVLDMSKIEAGQLQFDLVDFDLGGLLDDVEAMFGALATEKGVALEVDAAGALGLYHGDPVKIRQILTNLVSNALKFTASGAVRIRATRLSESAVELRVEDTGIGIPAESLGGLFERFTQADSSTTRRYGGTGLGLAICQELLEAMKGEIRVQSAPGQGTVFTVTAPLRYIRAAEVSVVAAPSYDPLPAVGAVRILCADDNATNRLVLSTILGQLGCEASVVENGEEAIAAWRTGRWDAVLMDVQMPVMDGLTAIRAIRREEQLVSRPRTPIITLTADALEHQVREHIAAGADLHLSKPIQIRALAQTLSAALDGDEALPCAA